MYNINKEPDMENQNEKAPKMNTGEGKKKRYYKKRKPKAVVANDVVKAEQGSSSPSPAASDTPTARTRKRSYGNKNMDQLGLPKLTASLRNEDDSKLQTTVNGKTVEHTKTRESIDRAMRISEEMIREKDYDKEMSAWDNGAHGYTEACAYSDCGCREQGEVCNESEYSAQVDWDGLLDRLEAMNAALYTKQRVTVWDRVRAFVEGVLEYDRPMYMLLIALLEIQLGRGYWAIVFGCLSITYFVTTSIQIVKRARYAAHVRSLMRNGVETYNKK